MMDDSTIIELFFSRSENAIGALSQKYGGNCKKLAYNILSDALDAEECVNDTYLGVWNTVPPQRPNPLLSYVSKICRNLSLKRYRYKTAMRRNSHYDVALDEIENCFPAPSTAEDEVLFNALTESINEFLRSQSKEVRAMFIKRYFFGDSVKDIAKNFKTTNHYVSVKLSRTREKLREYLIKEGFFV